MDIKELILLPNILSILRLILSIPTAYLLYTDFLTYKNIIILLFIILYLTDLLDGYIARKFNMISETGKIIDPLADKFTVIILSIVIFIKKFIPLWYFTIIVIRDLIILIFGIILRKKVNMTLMSNFPGKIAVFSIALILLISIINRELLNNDLWFLYIMSVLLIIYSLITYLNRFLKTIGEKQYAK
jgi:cardiolipin synthase